MRALAIAAALVAASSSAAAAPPRRDWNVAAPVHGILGGGLAVEGERQMWPRLSLGGFASLRSTASGDFSSIAAGAGAELRYWLLGWTVASPLRDSVVGGYFGAGVELSRTWLRDEVAGRGVGATTGARVTGSFGYRFAPWSRVSITPSVGLAIGRDVAGGIPDRFSVRPRYGLTVGALF